MYVNTYIFTNCGFPLTDGAASTTGSGFQDKGFDPTGWELALVTTPSNSGPSAVESQLVGSSSLSSGIDFLVLG